MELHDILAKLPQAIPLEKIEKAWKWATELHDGTGCHYGGQSYMIHIGEALAFAVKWIHVSPLDRWEDLLCAVILHDTTEDCRQSHNDVRKGFGKRIADLVYAVHSPKGHDRVERALLSYVEIRQDPEFVFVKMMDRLANFSNSLRPGSKMSGVYTKEHPIFRYGLYRPLVEFKMLDPIWAEMDALYDGAPKK